MNILLLSRYDRLGPSSRLRLMQYVPFLRDHGWTVDVEPLLDDRYIRDLYAGRPRRSGANARAYAERVLVVLRSRSYDLLWIQGELFPWLPDLAEQLLRASGIRYVVDYDDATFHRYDHNRSGLVRLALGRKIDRIMRGSALVVAGNVYLADRATKAGSRRVEIIPTVVDLDRYIVGPPRGSQDTVRIGWIGTPSTVDYLSIVSGPLRSVTEDGAAQFVAIGAEPTVLPGIPIDQIVWEEDTEAEALASIDIGIMPLPNGPWERGKNGYKLIQYMAAGRPVVASPVGVNTTIVAHGESGFISGTDEEWTRSLRTLIDDSALRHRMGRCGRARVEARYSLKYNAPRLMDLLQMAAED